jgi:hypothetical protein
MSVAKNGADIGMPLKTEEQNGERGTREGGREGGNSGTREEVEG